MLGTGPAQPARRCLQEPATATSLSIVPRVVLGAHEGPAFRLGAELGMSAQVIGAKIKQEAASQYQATPFLPGASFP